MPKLNRLPSSVVLDTHAWVWACGGDRRCGFLAEFKGRCTLPVIALWEVAMLVQKGRLELLPSVDEWVAQNTRPPVFLQSLTAEIAILSTRLEDFHGDPADRMIVATALVLQQPLATADRGIQDWFDQHHDYGHLLLGL
jgi:PIN domain nuclease of toxin-antitoxin system